MKEYEILDVHAVEILDARAIPTLDVTVTLKGGITGNAAVPGEALGGGCGLRQLRDGDKRHMGFGVEQAVTNVNARIADKMIGRNVLEQVQIDQMLIQADGTDNKRKYGANAILGVSLACARAAANALEIPLFRYLGGFHTGMLPIPLVCVAGRNEGRCFVTDAAEFMIAPVGAVNFSHAMEISCRICYELGKLQKETAYQAEVFTASEALERMMEAITRSGYAPGTDVGIAINMEASHLFDENAERYNFEREGAQCGKQTDRNAEEMVQYYEELVGRYPILMIENAMGNQDEKGWKLLMYRLGNQIRLVGDNVLAGNGWNASERNRETVVNTVSVQCNQIGTLTETMQYIERARHIGYDIMVSHSAGETADTFATDLAVAAHAEFIKAGAMQCGPGTAKYNRLLKVEESLGKCAGYHAEMGIWQIDR